jgi:hypothetical protein
VTVQFPNGQGIFLMDRLHPYKSIVGIAAAPVASISTLDEHLAI